MNEYAAVQLGMSLGLSISQNHEGKSMIDGMRWDYWCRLKDQEVTTFRGNQLVKEQ